MKQRALKVIRYGAVLIIAGCAYAFFGYKTGMTIPCVFRLITGLKCPGCGVTHMLIQLMRLDFKDAWNCNQAVMLMLPVFLYLLCTGLYRYIKYGTKKQPKHETVIEIALIIILILFGIVRNIPGLL